MSMILVFKILSESSDLERFRKSLDRDLDYAKSLSHGNGSGKKLAELVRTRACGDVVVFGFSLEEKIANASADDISDMAGLVEFL
jgi:hypothetical protein